MKQLIRYLIWFLLLFAAYNSQAQNNTVYGAGISYTNGVPTWTPNPRTSRAAVDTVTGRWYHFNTPGGWQWIGNTVEEIAGCAAPAYTPSKGDSRLVINNCVKPEVYWYDGAAWIWINEGTTYFAGEGIRIENDTIILDSLNFLDFRTGNALDGDVGRVQWNDTDGTLDLNLKGGNVTLQIGQEEVSLVKNADNSGLIEGRVVYIVGADGANKTVRYAKADSDATSATTFGLMTESATGGNKAFCTTFGLVRNLNTTNLTEGGIVWLSADTAGTMTAVRPTAPDHGVMIGFCVRKHATQGAIFVQVQNGYELNELHDVFVPSPTNGQVLTYNSTLSRWENTTPANQLQTLSTNSTPGNISISSGNTITLNVNDADASATNELQTLSVAANTATLSNSGGSVTIAGAGINTVGTAGTTITVTGTEVDGSTTNELQTLSTGTNTLTLSNGGGTVTVDTDPTNDLTGNGVSPFVAQYTGTSTLDTTGIVWNGGRMGIGITSTTPNAKLTVQGQGNTSTTTAINVQNSDGNALFRVFDNGVVNFGTQLNRGFWVNNDGSNLPDLAGASLRFSHSVSSQSQAGFVFRGANVFNATSGGQSNILYNQPFSPTSGTATFNQVLIDNTINQTGGANGISRGLYVRPILTSAADWRSIQWDNNSGWGLYGLGTASNYLAGNTTIGSTSTPARLHVVGSGTSSSTWTAQFHNSAGNNNALMIRDDGSVGVGTSTMNGKLNIDGGTSFGVYQSGSNVNYFQGGLAIGNTSDLNGYNLRILRNVGGLASSFSIFNETNFLSTVTTAGHGYTTSLSTQAASFNLNFIYHYRAQARAFGAGSTVGTQAAFFADGTLSGANNNYGFQGVIPAAANNFNLYMSSTAKNYLNGQLGIGTTTPNASAAFEVASTTQGVLFPRMTTAQRDLIATPADGLVIYNTTDNKLQVRAGGAWVDLH